MGHDNYYIQTLDKPEIWGDLPPFVEIHPICTQGLAYKIYKTLFV